MFMATGTPLAASKNQLKVQEEITARRSDGWLSTRIITTLLFHRDVRACATSVFVQDGVVTLCGDACGQAQANWVL